MLQNSADLDSALTKRLADFNAIQGNPIEYRVLGQTLGESDAIIYLKPQSHISGDPFMGIVDWAVALYTDASWTVFLPGDSGYTAAYDQLSPNLLSRATSAPYI